MIVNSTKCPQCKGHTHKALSSGVSITGDSPSSLSPKRSFLKLNWKRRWSKKKSDWRYNAKGQHREENLNSSLACGFLSNTEIPDRTRGSRKTAEDPVRVYTAQSEMTPA